MESPRRSAYGVVCRVHTLTFSPILAVFALLTLFDTDPKRPLGLVLSGTHTSVSLKYERGSAQAMRAALAGADASGASLARNSAAGRAMAGGVLPHTPYTPNVQPSTLHRGS